MVKLLHIGLGKCASTFLQKEIFPKIEKKFDIEYINFINNDYFNIKEKNIHTKINAFENHRNIENLLPKSFIISNESLFSSGWEFSRIEKSFENIKNNFSDDTIILIVIRNPYELLNSIYLQTFKSMKFLRPNEFFYIDDKEINKNAQGKFNLYNFDYLKLITLYKSYFKKVVVVKYEDIQTLGFLKDIFNADENIIRDLKKNTAGRNHNKSISKYGINFMLFLNNFLNIAKYQGLINKALKPNTNIYYEIKNKILLLFSIGVFFQKVFDKIIPYKKYYINRKYIPINIENEIMKYDELDF